MSIKEQLKSEICKLDTIRYAHQITNISPEWADYVPLNEVYELIEKIEEPEVVVE